VAGAPSGEIEFARPRRATPGRLLVAALFLGAAAGVVAWQLGWLQRLPLPKLTFAPAPSPRVEQPLPAQPAATAPASPTPDAPANDNAAAAPPPDTPRSDSAASAAPPAPAAPPETPRDTAATAALSAPAPAAAAPAVPPAPEAVPAPPAGPAVEQALLEPGPSGPLPIIARDGREPWRVYARPFDRGAALGVGYLYPVTVARIAAWARTLEQKELVLAPVSALGAVPGAAK
jgi:uncharacterized protein